MYMKKHIAPVLAAAVMLCGCSAGGYKADVDGRTVVAKPAGIRVEMPEGWNVYGSGSVYREMYKRSGDAYQSAGEMKKDYESDGQRCLALGESADASVICMVTVHDLTNDGGEQAQPADYARTVHDSTIFEYLAAGYKTGSDSSFTEGSEGGLDCWTSHFELFLPDGEGGEAQFVLGQTEYLFSHGDDMYSVQLVYSTPDGREQAQSVAVSAGG